MKVAFSPPTAVYKTTRGHFSHYGWVTRRKELPPNGSKIVAATMCIPLIPTINWEPVRIIDAHPNT